MTYYIVTSSYDDRGRVTANVTGTVEATERPDQVYRCAARKDIYIDYFETLRDARKYIEDALRA